MRLFKQIFTLAALITVLALPVCMMGCAEQSASSGGDAASDADSDLGEPEGGSALP